MNGGIEYLNFRVLILCLIALSFKKNQMNNPVIPINGGFIFKSFLFKGSEFWLSSNEVKSAEKFEAAKDRTGIRKSVEVFDSSKIQDISFNESSDTIKLSYINKKEKLKKLDLKFNDNRQATLYGNYLGEQLAMSKSSIQEQKTKPLLINASYLLLAVGLTIYFGFIDDASSFEEVGGTRRSRGNAALMVFLYNTIGQTGMIIIGTIISLFAAYQLFKRYKNPTNNVLFTKQ